MKTIQSPKEKLRKILIISPHPDDEILGCGGTIIKSIEKGDKVYIVFLTSGDSNQNVREKEALAVCRYLGISNHYFLRLQRKGLSVSLKNIEVLIDVLNKIKPEIVYINHELDADYEHRIAYQLVMQAYWRYNSNQTPISKIKGLLLYEIHTPMQKYNLVEDISKHINRKMKAMSFYKSQLGKSGIDMAIKGLNRYRGSMHENINYAEVFQIKKLTNI